MGNQYNLCKTNNVHICQLPPQNTERAEAFPVLYTIHKALNQFISQNNLFFQNQGRPIAFVLKSDNSFQQKINKFPIQHVTQEKKIYLPNLTKVQFALYEGECVFLDYAKSQFYLGKVKNGIKQGEGTLINKLGNIYYGYFKENQKNGDGCYEIIYPKRTYKGNWKKGKMQGYGKAIYQDEAQYQGQFYEGKKHGEGILTFPDGAVYQGSFQCDLMHGYGTLSTAKGKQISGQWKQGKYQLVKPQRTSRTFSINQLPV